MKYGMASRPIDINGEIYCFKEQLQKKCNPDSCSKSLPVCLIFCIFAILTDIIFPVAGGTDTTEHHRARKKKTDGGFVN